MKRYFAELDSYGRRLFTPVVRWMVYISFGVFLFQLLGLDNLIIGWFGASAGGTLHNFQLWQLVTYAFVHGSFGHIFFNLLGLYFFGQRLESRWGSADFRKFVIVTAAGAVFFHLVVTQILASFAGRSSWDIIIGMSGIVYGCMMACALYYPDDIVYFQFLIPIKMKYLVGILALFTLLATPQISTAGVAHLTHLGGLLVGFLYVRVPSMFDWIKLPRRRRPKPQIVRQSRYSDRR